MYDMDSPRNRLHRNPFSPNAGRPRDKLPCLASTAQGTIRFLFLPAYPLLWLACAAHHGAQEAGQLDQQDSPDDAANAKGTGSGRR